MHFLTLLRHGRSAADDENRYESRYDCPLTDTGRRQATALATAWAGDPQRRYDVIVTSPLKRATETASILSGILHLPVVQSDFLLELDAGALCGLPREEGQRRYPEPSFCGPYDRIVAGTGESEAQLHARALLALDGILNMGKTGYLAVSHGQMLNAILRAMLGIPLPVNRDGAFFRFTDTAYLDAAYERGRHRWIVAEFRSGP